jgi:pyruvate/2-oxoglutarate dehydrogenase complex dihydrolipoamide dehydrogenase (E3) component
MVGNRACDMITEVATMALEGGYQELERIVHPHPTSRRRSSTRPGRSGAIHA